jgi:hypothetical protein
MRIVAGGGEENEKEEGMIKCPDTNIVGAAVTTHTSYISCTA